MGSLASDHPSIRNADWDQSSLLDRSLTETEGINHPGRGAYTNYFNITLKSQKFIPKGMQIFQEIASGGWQYSSTGNLYPVDYEDADDLLTKIGGFIDEHSKDMNEKEQKELYSYFIKDVLEIVST